MIYKTAVESHPCAQNAQEWGTRQFFPRDGHCFACFQIFDPTRYFRIPSLFDRRRFIRTLKSVEQGIR